MVENRTIVDNLKFRDRKLVALEMESYGFYIAGRNCGLPKTEFVMVKGVCDSATPPKTDKFQKYAAFVSAQFIHNFILAEGACARRPFRAMNQATRNQGACGGRRASQDPRSYFGSSQVADRARPSALAGSGQRNAIPCRRGQFCPYRTGVPEICGWPDLLDFLGGFAPWREPLSVLGV